MKPKCYQPTTTLFGTGCVLHATAYFPQIHTNVSVQRLLAIYDSALSFNDPEGRDWSHSMAEAETHMHMCTHTCTHTLAIPLTS